MIDKWFQNDINKVTLTKENMNKRGYNKFLKMEGDIRVTIDYGKLEADAEFLGDTVTKSEKRELEANTSVLLAFNSRRRHNSF